MKPYKTLKALLLSDFSQAAFMVGAWSILTKPLTKAHMTRISLALLGSENEDCPFRFRKRRRRPGAGVD